MVSRNEKIGQLRRFSDAREFIYSKPDIDLKELALFLAGKYSCSLRTATETVNIVYAEWKFKKEKDGQSSV